MLNFSGIKNEKLRQLVSASESIKSLPEEQGQAMVDKMAALPESSVGPMVKVFEEEAKKIAAAKLAKGITPEIEQKKLEEKIVAVHKIKKDFECGVRVEEERVDQEAVLVAADELLKKL